MVTLGVDHDPRGELWPLSHQAVKEADFQAEASLQVPQLVTAAYLGGLFMPLGAKSALPRKEIDDRSTR